MKEDTKVGMGMMQEMMQNMMKGTGSMPEMCAKMMQQMMVSATESANAKSFTTPEMKGLFEEWARTLEEEVIAFVKEKGKTNPADTAAKLKISEESVLFLVGKLAREGKIIIGEIRASE